MDFFVKNIYFDTLIFSQTAIKIYFHIKNVNHQQETVLQSLMKWLHVVTHLTNPPLEDQAM